MNKRPEVGARLERVFTLERAGADEESRTITAALSSELPVDRDFGREILVHDKAAINMERAVAGLPLLFGHRSDTLVGRVENIALSADRKLRGNLRFSKSAKGEEAWQDVRDGMLQDISIGYRIDKWEESAESEGVRVIRWTPLEASVVTVPADHTVGINRQLQDRGSEMTADENAGSGTAATTEPVIDLDQFQLTRKTIEAQGREAGRQQERARTGQIRNVFALHVARGPQFGDLMNACIDKGLSVEQSKDALLELLGGETEPLGRDYVQSPAHGSLDRRTIATVQQESPTRVGAERIEMGRDSVEKFGEGAELSLLVRAGLITDKEKIAESRKCEFRGLTLSELASESLRISGARVSGKDRMARVGEALTRASTTGHGSSDFANLLENVANKALLIGYNEAEETWSAWCRRGSLSDFKIASRVQLSGFTDLELVTEQGEFTHGTVSDSKETMFLSTYGKLFGISRQAVINDDLDGLARVPSSMGRAAARKIGDLAYAPILATHLMGDGVTLFDASAHSNYNATGTAPSVVSIEAMRSAMRLQTDGKGNTVGLAPAFLLCSTALEGTVRVLQIGQYDPAGTAGTLTPNTVQGTFETVSDPRLDAASGIHSVTDWYMAASPSRGDTVEVAFLDGNDTPFLEQKQGWTVDGTEFKVRIDAVAKALDWRFMRKQNGA